MAQYPNFNFNGSRQSADRRKPVPRPPAQPPPPKVDIPPSPASQQEPPACTVSPSQMAAAPRDLQNLLTGWDGERIALLALLYLLYKEGTDPALLLALAYILL